MRAVTRRGMANACMETIAQKNAPKVCDRRGLN